MATDVIGAKQRWIAAAVGAVILVAFAVSIFRAPSPAVPVPQVPAQSVVLRKVTAEPGTLGDETMMRDLTPMFLPTERNARLRKLPAREPGQSVLDVERPRLGIADSGWRFDQKLPRVVTLDGAPVSRATTALEVFEAIEPDARLFGFGREAVTITSMPPRGALVEIVNNRDGRRLFSEVLEVKARPVTDKVWQPLEFLAAVGPAGLIAPLTLTTRSGVEEVDFFYRNYLVRTYRVGERLAPGFYRITVAP